MDHLFNKMNYHSTAQRVYPHRAMMFWKKYGRREEEDHAIHDGMTFVCFHVVSDSPSSAEFINSFNVHTIIE